MYTFSKVIPEVIHCLDFLTFLSKFNQVEMSYSACTHTFLPRGNLTIANSSNEMFLGGRRKPESPEETLLVDIGSMKTAHDCSRNL